MVEPLRILEEGKQRVVAHVEEVMTEVIVRRLAAVALERNATDMYKLHLHHTSIEIHSRGQIVGDQSQVVDTANRC
jgi:hypothetical protein